MQPSGQVCGASVHGVDLTAPARRRHDRTHPGGVARASRARIPRPGDERRRPLRFTDTSVGSATTRSSLPSRGVTTSSRCAATRTRLHRCSPRTGTATGASRRAAGGHLLVRCDDPTPRRRHPLRGPARRARRDARRASGAVEGRMAMRLRSRRIRADRHVRRRLPGHRSEHGHPPLRSGDGDPAPSDHPRPSRDWPPGPLRVHRLRHRNRRHVRGGGPRN